MSRAMPGYTVSFESPTMRRVLAVLAAASEPLTDQQIAERAHASLYTLRNDNYLPALRKAKRIHVAQWRKDHSGRQIACYAIGNQPDAKRPKFCAIAASRAWKQRTGYQAKITAQRHMRRAAEPSMLALVAGVTSIRGHNLRSKP